MSPLSRVKKTPPNPILADRRYKRSVGKYERILRAEGLKPLDSANNYNKIVNVTTPYEHKYDPPGLTTESLNGSLLFAQNEVSDYWDLMKSVIELLSGEELAIWSAYCDGLTIPELVRSTGATRYRVRKTILCIKGRFFPYLEPGILS